MRTPSARERGWGSENEEARGAGWEERGRAFARLI